MPITFNPFDPKNLEANRRGELTDEQKKEIYAKLSASESLTFMVITGIIAVVGLCMLPSVLSLSLPLFNGSWVDGWGGLLMMAGYLLVLFGWIKVWKHIIKSKRNKTVLSICQGRGQLSFKNGGYGFEANDGSFALPFNNEMGLLPGTTYNIYSLAENNGILLSVEPLPSEDKIAPTQEMSSVPVIDKHAALNKVLADVNGFSFEDLKANRNGEITDQQRKKVKSPKMSAIFFGYF